MPLTWYILKSYLIGGLEHFLFSHILGNNHPNWLICFRGVGVPPTRYSHTMENNKNWGFWHLRVMACHPPPDFPYRCHDNWPGHDRLARDANCHHEHGCCSGDSNRNFRWKTVKHHTAAMWIQDLGDEATWTNWSNMVPTWSASSWNGLYSGLLMAKKGSKGSCHVDDQPIWGRKFPSVFWS